MCSNNEIVEPMKQKKKSMMNFDRKIQSQIILKTTVRIKNSVIVNVICRSQGDKVSLVAGRLIYKNGFRYGCFCIRKIRTFYKNKLKTKVKLHLTSAILMTYSGEILGVLGEITVNIMWLKKKDQPCSEEIGSK